jgi:hypothetical protein
MALPASLGVGPPSLLALFPAARRYRRLLLWLSAQCTNLKQVCESPLQVALRRRRQDSDKFSKLYAGKAKAGLLQNGRVDGVTIQEGGGHGVSRYRNLARMARMARIWPYLAARRV